MTRALRCGGLAALLLTSAANAQPAASAPPAATAPPAASAPPAQAPPVIEMPRPLTPLVADYPAGGEGDAVVIVRLLVEKDGSVAEASVAQGSEPFSSAALTAAKGFRFAPARRDGTPIRAAIRAEVKFTAPPPAGTPPADSPPPAHPLSTSAPPGSAAPSPSGTTAAPAPPAPQPIDVSVRGNLAPPGATTMSRAEVRLLPGAFGDPFRAVEALPGVTPIASGLPYFFVRGAPPGNVGYFLDGIRVPLLYHLGLGPSVVHPGIVDRVDLYPGGYPARLGRFAGGIVAGETRTPQPELHGEAELRIVDAGALVEAPFAGGRGAALVAGRYSYTGLLFSILQSNVQLDYWDYQARVSYDISPSETVTLFAFGARDVLADKSPRILRLPAPDGTLDFPYNKPRVLVDTTFHRVDLRYDRRLGPGSALRHAVTFGYDETGFEKASVSDKMIATRSELKLALSPSTTFRAGADAMLDAIKTSLKLGFIPISLSNRYDFAGGAWADVVVQVTDRLEVTPGLRVDLYGSTGAGGGAALAVEPRLSAVLRVTPWLRLVQAHGFATQRPSFFLPGPGFSPDLQARLQKSFQTSAGIEADVPLDMEAKVTFFRDAFFDMTDPFSPDTFSGSISPEPSDVRAMGSSIGMELSLRRRMTKRVGGFLSYTLSRSERVSAKGRLPAATNRTHVLNAALGVDIAWGVRAGARFIVYSGFPEINKGVDTGKELPPFFRLDARLEKKWTLGRSRWLSLVLEMQNTTLSTEVLGVCDGKPCKPIGPIAIPSIGLEGGI